MDSWSYSKAGVDLTKHKSMHNYVLKLLRDLNDELGYEIEDLGGYATSININNTKIVLHIDGVGTKTIVLQKLGKMRVAGWDCVAMNVNDVVCNGAKPIALIDYIAMPSADENMFKDIVEGVVEASKYAGVAVLGGETAILPDLVNGIDVVCTVLAVKKKNFTPKVEIGDAIVGVSSWGLHANGYSLVRKILDNIGISYDSSVDGVSLGEELSKPTAIYSNLVTELIEKRFIKAAAHITGGAFTKLRRIANNNVDLILNMPKPPKIFELIMKLGNVDIDEMYKVFNMGIGMVLVIEKENLENVEAIVEKYGFNFYRLGEVVGGEGRVVLNTCYGVRIYL